MLGQRIGRRRFFLIVGPLIAKLGSTIFGSYPYPHLSFPVVVTLVCLLAVLVMSPWSVIVTYINECFVKHIRATGFGIGFSLSVIYLHLPSFTRFIWIG